VYTDNELFFPITVIPTLKHARGERWGELVARIEHLPECHEETLAFMLMMTRLNGCSSCETDSYRAMRGCGACTHQTLRRFKGSDDELVAAFERALGDIRQFAEEHATLGQFVLRETVQQRR
jgi:hypothetical protein